MTTMPASTVAAEDTAHTTNAATTTTTPADPSSTSNTNNNAVQQISPPPTTKKKSLLERLRQQYGELEKLEASNTQQGSSSSLTHTPTSANATLSMPSSLPSSSSQPSSNTTNVNAPTAATVITTPTSKATSSNGKRFIDTTTGAVALPTTPEPNTPTRSKRTRRANKFNQLINGEELPTLPEHIQKKLVRLMSVVRKHKWAWPFNQPVDPVQLNIPDYFTIIKNPMDLGTVEKKVLNNEYMDVYQFLDDVRLIWSNCFTYNPLDSDVCNMAKELERFFNEKYEKLIGQVGVDTPLEITTPTQSIGLEEVPFVTTPSTVKKGRGRKKKSLTETTPSAAVSSTAASTATMPSEQVTTPREVTPSKSKSSTKSKSKTKSSSKSKSKSKKSSEPEMTYEDKKELSANIGKLDGVKLAEVVRIIQRMAPTASSKANETEIEIDLNQLDNATLVELNNFVKLHLPKKETQKKKATSTTKKKRKTSPVKEKKPKKTKKEESDSESTATDNSASESSATETESSESDSSDSDSDMEDVKTVPPSSNNLGDQAKQPAATSTASLTNEAPRSTATTATTTTTHNNNIHPPHPNTPSSAKALNFPNISTSNLYPNATLSTSATTPTSQKPTTTSTAGNVNIIPTKKQLDAALKVDESSWNSLLDEEDQDNKKRIATDDHANSSKWNEFQQHQKRQSELEEKMKMLREQKEEERRQQSLNASHFRIDERELAKRQREEERHNKLSEDLDAEAFAKEMFE
ncbi:hypothetical protein C9374_012025 [Naegleria lovaniensis]|uniref:Bromodomain-containing protein n=1 Tax=Naegleria lovaniensis TaxID=51637 RepID=A0AA88G8Z7_NAELO|nr:uncharacterized protein C9374_012025 [Naegleria lovaniensis]KAG2373562.1 hypothetical protein C9374_012025 [Naegleria lovaniensis]